MILTQHQENFTNLSEATFQREAKVISGFRDLQQLHPKSIVIYGGSFDPPHLGHLGVIKGLKKQADLVVVMPLGRNPLKPSQPFASDQQRIEMLKVMLQGEENVYVATEEIDRAQRTGKPTITIDTLTVAKKELPAVQLKLSMSSDCLRNIHLWDHYTSFFDMAELIVVKRPGHPIESWEKIAENVGWNVASKLSSGIFEIGGLPEISSSYIRSCISHNAEDAFNAVDSGVRDYILRQGMYGATQNMSKISCATS